MREKYESLSLATLKELAKARGLKGISTLRKPALIERMLQEDEKERKDTGAISETVQKEEIREEKKDRQEEHQTPVRQYRQNGHVQESRAFYDNRRKNNWQEGGTRTYNSASEGRRYGNSQSEFSKNHAVRMKAADTEILRERISECTEAKMKAADTEILRMKIPEFIIVRTKTEEADTARRRIREHIIIRMKAEEADTARRRIREHIIIRTKTEEADTVRRKIREPSAVRMKTEEAIYSRMMQRFRQKQRSWTAARKPMEFSRSFRTDMGLSAVKTFFRERMIFMFLRPRSADLI